MGNKMKEPLDLNKKRVIPEVTYSVVENLGWDSRNKKQRTIGTITQLQYLDLQDELEDALAGIDQDKIKLIDEKTDELLLECKVGDKYHQLLLEVGLNTVLERVLEYDIFWEKLDKEWTPLDEEE
tara:strand:+ start:1393 stop:1767 length:375 start_codon:yes stop_codon:yes gene_type:complete